MRTAIIFVLQNILCGSRSLDVREEREAWTESDFALFNLQGSKASKRAASTTGAHRET